MIWKLPHSHQWTHRLFSQYEMAEAAVMGIHQSFGETNSYRGRYLPYYGINSDVEWINGLEASGINDGGKNDLATYNAQPSNSQMNTDNNAYAKFYEGIERANKAIEGIRAYGNYENNPDMAHLLGEALTLRAVIYLDLIKGWGDVPARFLLSHQKRCTSRGLTGMKYTNNCWLTCWKQKTMYIGLMSPT